MYIVHTHMYTCNTVHVPIVAFGTQLARAGGRWSTGLRVQALGSMAVASSSWVLRAMIQLKHFPQGLSLIHI